MPDAVVMLIVLATFFSLLFLHEDEQILAGLLKLILIFDCPSLQLLL